jgi:hypothetical protein
VLAEELRGDRAAERSEGRFAEASDVARPNASICVTPGRPRPSPPTGFPLLLASPAVAIAIVGGIFFGRPAGLDVTRPSRFALPGFVAPGPATLFALPASSLCRTCLVRLHLVDFLGRFAVRCCPLFVLVTFVLVDTFLGVCSVSVGSSLAAGSVTCSCRFGPGLRRYDGGLFIFLPLGYGGGVTELPVNLLQIPCSFSDFDGYSTTLVDTRAGWRRYRGPFRVVIDPTRVAKNRE